MNLVSLLVPLLLLQPESAKPVAPATTVTVRVFDQSNNPVAGAQVGSNAYRGETDTGTDPWLIGFFAEADVSDALTGPDGAYRVPLNALLFGPDDARPKSIIAWTPDRAKVGLAKWTPGEAEVRVSLAPACRVTVTTASKGLVELGLTLKWANVYVHWGDLRPFGCNSINGAHEFMLPPGEYKLNGYGTDTYSQTPMLTIGPGEIEKTIALDLPANRLATLVGKPAPELASIKGWKNGGPVTLADLKGKIVILDFWGHWCGPCVHSMPALMDLHDQYKDKGLVIIAVHDDSADSIADMDKRLETVRRDIWKGRDLPFLVALDGGGDVAVPGREGVTARGATTAAYGINSFPTQVLIDRDGKVVGQLRKGRLQELLAQLK